MIVSDVNDFFIRVSVDVFHNFMYSIFCVAASQSAINEVVKHINYKMLRSVVIFLNKAVILAVIEMLLQEIAWIVDLIINNFAILHNWNDVRVDETAIRFESESIVTFLHLFMKFRVDIHSISLDEFLTGLVVAFRLNALDFSKKLAK